MKPTLNYIVLTLITVLFFFSCAKDRGPRLIINVIEEDGTPAVGATVHAWPTDGPFECGSCIVDEEKMDQTTITDGAGVAMFDFKFSVVLDVEVVYFKEGVDSLLQPVITDTLFGKKVVKIEEKRQRSKKNNFQETVVVK
ncbi:MAG: hypothetical protein RQ875_11480 [Vicingaceae bacterium]|nr:hypothetical protein [Vicingaceae bacterium]